jgi:superfamily II DNA or RNA helicase
MQKSLFDDNQKSQPASQIIMDPSFQDRCYQAEAIAGSFEAFDAGEPGALVRAFTGAGKTYMGARISAEWLNRSERARVFVCAHERQLVNQFRDELIEFLGIPVGLEMSDDGRMSYGPGSPRVVVSCRATLREDQNGCSRLYKFNRDEFDWLLIMDEAHRWAYSLPSCRPVLEWFEANSESKRLALTATPERSDGISLERIAPAVALDYPMFSASGPSAIDDGWAVPFDQKFIHVEGVDFKNLREVAGDFDKKELEQILQEKEQLASMIRPLLDLCGDRQTVIFNAGVDLAKAVARALNAERSVNGATHREAMWLDGSVSDEIRSDVFKRHQAGEFQFLSVCGLCREGYNDPGIQCIAIFRPTKSSGLAEQMIGRGCRPLRGTVDGLDTAEERRAAIADSDKPTCRIIDLVGASGLGQCATTAHLYAIGQDDVPALDLSVRANEILMAQDEDEGPADVGEAIKKAQSEIKADQAAAKLARAEQERIEQERKNREATILADVKYEVTGTAAHSSMSSSTTMATSKQIWLLGELGVSKDVAKGYTKRQASAVISRLKNGTNSAEKALASKSHKRSGKATDQQLRVLEKFDWPAGDDCTFEQAAQAINEINETVLAQE